MRQTPENGIDPDVKVPAAVRAAAARSEKFYEKPVGEGETPEDTKGVEEIKLDGSTVGQPQETEKEPAPTANEQGTDGAPAKAAEGARDTPQGNPPAEGTWEHKYNSMKGRFDRATADLRTQAQRITHLENMIATMQATAPSNTEEPTKAQPASQIPAELREEWGEEFFDVVNKTARESMSPDVQDLKQQVQELKQQLGNVNGYVAGNAKQRMLGELDTELPNWREINTNDNFIAWLQLPDTYSGAIRHELLKAAFERNDSPRVAAFFKGFLAEEAAMAPAERGPDPKEDKPSSKVPLNTLAAPGRAKSAAATAPAEKPTISRAQISSFYRDLAAGVYAGKEEEAQRLEKMIFDAQKDGRIR